MIVTCSACKTSYRFDEARVPGKGLRVRCTRCRRIFLLHAPPPPAPSTGARPSRERATTAGGHARGPGHSPPLAEIERLARVIVSDLEVYHPERLEKSIRKESFFEEFRVDLDEARRLVGQRYPDFEGSVAALESALELVCAERREAAAPLRS